MEEFNTRFAFAIIPGLVAREMRCGVALLLSGVQANAAFGKISNGTIHFKSYKSILMGRRLEGWWYGGGCHKDLKCYLQ